MHVLFNALTRLSAAEPAKSLLGRHMYQLCIRPLLRHEKSEFGRGSAIQKF